MTPAMPGRPLPITAIVLTRNEEANLPACLDSLRAFAEVVVVDSASRDRTVEIAIRAGVRVERFDWSGGHPKKKQWCLERLALAHDWVMFVDADERVTPALVAELARLFAAPPDAAAFAVRSRPVVLGRVLRFGGYYRKVAVMNRHRCRYPVCDEAELRSGWDVEGHYQPAVAGRVGALRAPLLHQDSKGPAAWFERHNLYSDWEAEMTADRRRRLEQSGEGRVRRLAKRLFHRLPCRPLLIFLGVYVARLGLLDGRAGYHHAAARAFYYWQVEYKRAWIKAGNAGRNP